MSQSPAPARFSGLELRLRVVLGTVRREPSITLDTWWPRKSRVTLGSDWPATPTALRRAATGDRTDAVAVVGVIDHCHSILDTSAQSKASLGDLLSAAKDVQRLLNWAEATKVRLLAAMTAPDLHGSPAELLELVQYAATEEQVPESHALQPISADYECESYSQTRLAGDPLWDSAITVQTTKLAALELSVASRDTTVSATSAIRDARDLVETVPATVAAWQRGEIDRRRVRIIHDRLSVLEDLAARERAEDVVLQPENGRPASEVTARTLRSRCDRAVIAIDPEATRRRAEVARQRRAVTLTPTELDMARLSVDLPAPSAVLAREVLDHLARNLPEELHAQRTIDQRRADAFAEIFESLARTGTVDIRAMGRKTSSAPTTPNATMPNPASVSSRHLDVPAWKALGSTVSVIITGDTLIGDADEPGYLDRFGWISPDLARACATSAAGVRAILHTAETWTAGPNDAKHPAEGHDQRRNPETRWCGTQLDFGRTVYRPPAALDDYVRTRDRTCRFPGCAIPASNCQIDHRVPYDHSTSSSGGATCPCNLQCLCAFHHRVKTFTAWRAVQVGNELHWISPLGQQATVEAPELPQDRPAQRLDPGRLIDPAQPPKPEQFIDPDEPCPF